MSVDNCRVGELQIVHLSGPSALNPHRCLAVVDVTLGSAPAERPPVVEEPSLAEPPMWLDADGKGKLLPEPQPAQCLEGGSTAQPSGSDFIIAPSRPSEAALRLAVPASIASVLRPYQREGVRFLFRYAC